MHSKYGERKQELLKNHPETVVEIGAGYGANFRYLNPGTKVIAIEPNEALHPLLEQRAKNYEINIQLHSSGAEEMNIPDNSAEMVLGSLVLCSVDDPVKAISEIVRILKPGGEFVYIEHVKDHTNGWIYSIQRSVKKPWKWFFDGCHITRDTGKTIRESGFSKIDQVAFSNRTIFVPVIPHIAGKATK
ncbi:MAG TPA: class I SAM-dependent methyltransferase [Gracilimonas sp.]|nr:class I SAM-dependent methyltransferase [Gracilimonas sp.]